LSPIVTALLAFAVLGEELVAVQWAGMVVATFGVALAQRGQAPQAPPAISAPVVGP